MSIEKDKRTRILILVSGKIGLHPRPEVPKLKHCDAPAREPVSAPLLTRVMVKEQMQIAMITLLHGEKRVCVHKIKSGSGSLFLAVLGFGVPCKRVYGLSRPSRETALLCVSLKKKLSVTLSISRERFEGFHVLWRSKTF